MEFRNHKLERPIVQGGMGIGISLECLAGAVASEGGLGVLSSAYAGIGWKGFDEDPRRVSLQALTERIRAARKLAGDRGLIGVNIMCAVEDYAAHVASALKGGVDAIISGAGLPLKLPALVPEGASLIAPVVSSGRVAALICKYWQKHYRRLPDFIVAEGPEAGGHLGFERELLENRQWPSRAQLFAEIQNALQPFVTAAGRSIPIVIGGGVSSRADVQEVLAMGAAGAQIATRFIPTEECDASQGFKDILLAARAEDVMIVQSPVGLPGRALRTPLMESIAAGERRPPKRCFKCLGPCDSRTTPYCISAALVAACRGDRENGLFFCGSRVAEMTTMTTVPKLFTEWLAKEGSS